MLVVTSIGTAGYGAALMTRTVSTRNPRPYHVHSSNKIKHISVMLILQFIISFTTSSIFAVSPKDNLMIMLSKS